MRTKTYRTAPRVLVECAVALALVAIAAIALVSSADFGMERAWATEGLKAQSGYQIVFHLNGGEQRAGQAISIAPGKTINVKSLKKPVRKGYKFMGWYKNKKLTKKARTIIGSPKASKRTLYAKWKAKTYHITYKLRDGKLKGSYPTTYKCGRGCSLPTPTRKGYLFDGWYSDSGLTKQVTEISKTMYGNKTLYAKWTAREYAIVYHPDGGALANGARTTYTIKTTCSLPSASKPGYAFIGWYSDEKLTKPVNGIDAGTTGKKHFYARWKERIAVAHRGYHADAPQNSAQAYEAASLKGFKYAETDVRFTSDNVGILSHNATVKIYALGRDVESLAIDVPVTSLTYEQLCAIKFVQGTSGPDGANISTFDDFANACAQFGLCPLIEVKAATKAQVSQMAATIDRLGLADKARWASFDKTVLDYVHAVRPKADLIVLTSMISKSSVKTAQAYANAGVDVALSTRASTMTAEMIGMCKEAHIPLGTYTLANETQISAYDPYLYSFSLDGVVAETLPAIL